MRSILILLAGAATLAATPSLAADYFVLATPGHLAKAKKAAIAAGGTVGTEIAAIDAFTVSSSSSGFASSLAKKGSVNGVSLNANVFLDTPAVAHMAPPKTVAAAKAAHGSDDFFAGLQWSLDAVSAEDAWAEGYTGAGVKVCVIDSGMYADHGDLVDNLNVSDSASMIDGEDWDDVVAGNHGTHVGGIIAASANSYGTLGIAPDAELVAVKVLSAYSGSGSFEDVIEGMIYSADVGCDIGNMSLSGLFFKSGDRKDELCIESEGCFYSARDAAVLKNAMTRAAAYAEKQGMLIVAAASNDSIDYDHASDLLVVPAGLPGVVAVSALGPTNWGRDSTAGLDHLAFYSNYGTSLIHHSGPGGNVDLDEYLGFDPSDPDAYCVVDGSFAPCWVFNLVISSVPADAPGGGLMDGWSWNAGTSMASPAAAAVAALACEELGSKCSPKALRKVLKSSSDDLGKPGADSTHGHGRVNAYEAVK